MTLDPGAVQRLDWVRTAAIGTAMLLLILIAFQPWLLAAALALANPAVRKRIRAATTRAVDRAASG